MNKNSTTIILIIIIIAAIVATILLKKNEPVKTDTLSESDTQINQAIEADTTVSINAALNDIKVDDTTDKDLADIDAELKNL